MNTEYYHTKASVNEYIAAAKDVNGQALIDQMELVLPNQSTLLELGSGPGSDWEILSNSYRVTGSDYSKVFVNHLKSSFTSGQFLELDAVTLKVTDSFDGIYSNKVLHHLNDKDLLASIQRQADLLNSGGIICHSFWKGSGSEVFKGMYVNYHSTEEIRTYFSKAFEILTLDEYAEFEAGDSVLIIAKKK